MRIGPAAKRPMIFSFRLLDWEIVDACLAKPHQTIVAKLPILIAIRAKPLPRVVVPFVSEAHGNAVPGVSPELFALSRCGLSNVLRCFCRHCAESGGHFAHDRFGVG